MDPQPHLDFSDQKIRVEMVWLDYDTEDNLYLLLIINGLLNEFESFKIPWGILTFLDKALSPTRPPEGV